MAAGAVALLALLLCASSGSSCAALRAAQRVDPRRPTSRTSSRTPPRSSSSSRRCTTTSQDAAERLDSRMETAERRIDSAVAYRALIRYDAYGEMSGRQSTSIALLDANRSGLVLSSIHHRDQARLYAKEVRRGQARARALARGGRGDPPRARGGRAAALGLAGAPLATRMRVALLRSRGHLHPGGPAQRHGRAGGSMLVPLRRRSTTP